MTTDNAERARTGDGGSASFDPGILELEAVVVLAGRRLPVAELARLQRRGALSLPADGRVWLEAGGRLIAEGELRRREGMVDFVVTRLLQEGELAS